MAFVFYAMPKPFVVDKSSIRKMLTGDWGWLKTYHDNSLLQFSVIVAYFMRTIQLFLIKSFSLRCIIMQIFCIAAGDL